MGPIRFTLYIAGRSPRSQQAMNNLRRLVEHRLGGECEMVIVDVSEDPEAAEQDRILTTPTLIKRTPGPERRVTGDLSDGERVLSGLALDWIPVPPTQAEEGR